MKCSEIILVCSGFGTVQKLYSKVFVVSFEALRRMFASCPQVRRFSVFMMTRNGVRIRAEMLLVHQCIRIDGAMCIKSFSSSQILIVGAQLLSTIFSPFSAFSVVFLLVFVFAHCRSYGFFLWF